MILASLRTWPDTLYQAMPPLQEACDLAQNLEGCASEQRPSEIVTGFEKEVDALFYLFLSCVSGPSV